MTTQTNGILAAADVIAKLANVLSEGVLTLMAATETTPRAVEEGLWSLILDAGRNLLTSLKGQRCRRVAEQEAHMLRPESWGDN